MDELRVRIYNVGFGDAILISIPDAEEGRPRLRHVLIDVGNALNTEGGKDFVFKPVVENIRETLAGEPIDLYIMTHEHMDHVQGLFYAETKENLQPLPLKTAWLTASAAPDYYERAWPDTDAEGNPLQSPKKHLDDLEASYLAIERYTLARKNAGEAIPQAIQAMLLNNNPRSSKDCVTYLRGLAETTCYIHREFNDTPACAHPFEVAELEVWAPEENTAVYYGSFRPMALGLAGGPQGSTGEADEQLEIGVPIPPRGVDAGAFYRLVESRKSNMVENLLAIDKSRNNSSIVFCLSWQGWKLLFPGDAEVRSWLEMDKHHQLSPVHFLKISHHASHNGTPADEILDEILPPITDDNHQRVAVASTYPNTYAGIPHEPTLARLEERGISTYLVYEELDALRDNPGGADGITAGYLDFTFPAQGSEVGMSANILGDDR